jgi:hypothetical protein
MKRILTLILGLASLLGAASLAFTSCVEDPFLTPHQGTIHNSRHEPGDNTKPDQGKDDDKDDQDRSEATYPGSTIYEMKAKALYFGHKYSDDADDYVLFLYHGEYDEDGNFVDKGTEIALDMLCKSTDEMKITTGKYTCPDKDDITPGHILKGVQEGDDYYPSYMYRQYSTESSSIDLITSATAQISGSGDDYSIKIYYTTDKEKKYLWTYTGSVEFIDMTSSGDADIPKDVKIEKFSRATVENLGGIWEDKSLGQTAPVDDWVVTLYGENYNSDKEYVTIELLSDQNAKSLPTGKYSGFVNPSSASVSVSDFTSGLIIAGYAEDTTPYGTWYCKGGNAYYAALQGSLNIEEKDGSYTIDFAFTDTDETYGGSFSGCYTGKLETVSPSSSSVARAYAPAFRSSLATRSQSGVTRNSAGSGRPMRNAAVVRHLETR